MTAIERLRNRTKEPDDAILEDCIESARNSIMQRRFPYQEWPEEVEPRYQDLLYRIALDLYNKDGAEGEVAHTENGVSRSYESSWISEQLLSEVVPYVGVL